MSDGSFRIKDWEVFQHFKDRRPPWIKLYRDLLDDPEWHFLDAESSKILVMLWLIASEDKTGCGNLPKMSVLCFRLRTDEKTLKKTLDKLSHWVISDDIATISERYHDGPPEKRREEGEEETEKRQSKSQKGTSGRDIEIMNLWNSIVDGTVFPKIVSITGKRKTDLESRLKDPEFMERFEPAVRYMLTQDWCCGRGDTKKWIADFDYMVRDGVITKQFEKLNVNNQKPTTPDKADLEIEQMRREILDAREARRSANAVS